MASRDIAGLASADRIALGDWIGERPGTVLPIHALASGLGRLAVAGEPASPDAVLVESPLVPGEPQGYGDPEALLDLLSATEGWTCVELEPELARALSDGFQRRWGQPRTLGSMFTPGIADGASRQVRHRWHVVRCNPLA